MSPQQPVWRERDGRRRALEKKGREGLGGGGESGLMGLTFPFGRPFKGIVKLTEKGKNVWTGRGQLSAWGSAAPAVQRPGSNRQLASRSGGLLLSLDPSFPSYRTEGEDERNSAFWY